MNCYYILSYITGYLRLGCIATNCHQMDEAFNWFQEALSVDHQTTKAWMMLENLHMTKLRWGSVNENQIIRVRGVNILPMITFRI